MAELPEEEAASWAGVPSYPVEAVPWARRAFQAGEDPSRPQEGAALSSWEAEAQVASRAVGLRWVACPGASLGLQEAGQETSSLTETRIEPRRPETVAS